MSEDDFRTAPRVKIQEKLLEVSRATFPKLDQFAIDDNLAEAFAGEDTLSEETAGELSSWLQTETGLDVNPEELAGLTFNEARKLVWNTYDEKHRPEMRRMERNLLLTQVDTSWKNQLYAMDHLRQGTNLAWVGQEDPKTVYKREGMREFEAMWKSLRDKISETVFRMEQDEAFEESVWSISDYGRDNSYVQNFPEGGIQAQQQAAIAASTNQEAGKKAEPIRNRTAKVGRNDPCPCNSGKKYKNCCMRKMVG
jgi:preprotein translocase subunit SecA